MVLAGVFATGVILVWFWDGNLTVRGRVLAAEDSLPIPEARVALYTLGGRPLGPSWQSQDSTGRFRVNHSLLHGFRMRIWADCRRPVEHTVSVLRSLLGSETYYLRDTWGLPPQIDSYCPVTAQRDEENRPVIISILEREEVRRWLEQWVEQGLGDIATEALTWDTTLKVGTWEFTIVEPHFRSMGYIPPGPPYGPLVLSLTYSPFGSNCGMKLVVLELEEGQGIRWAGPDRTFEVQLDECWPWAADIL